jgi:cyanophycinase
MQAARFLLLVLLLATSPLWSQGSVLLVGGGSENYGDWSDEPYRWLVEHAANRRIAILHYAEPSTFLLNYFKSLGANDAVNVIISNRAAANDSATYRAIAQADGVFLRGGDQWLYVSSWKGTLAEAAIRAVHQRGGAIGGTSAGAMVLSEVVFDARFTSVDPRTALRAPMQAGLSFTDDFLNLLPSAVIDTHFYERGRLGRLLAMLAVYRDQKGRWVTGVGIDDRTALGVSPDGSAEVFGSGVVSMLYPTARTRHLAQSSLALAISDIHLVQMTKGFRVNAQSGDLLFIPPTATVFTPKSLIHSPASVILDGSDQSADWFSSTGSFTSFLESLANPMDPVGIFSSPASTAAAQSLATELSHRGIPHHLLWIDSAKKNDLALANQIGACDGFAFVANQLDSLSSFLSPSTLTGAALQTKLANSAPLLFLGDDTKLIGGAGAGQTEFSSTAAYRGRLTLINGMNIAGGLMVMPRAYQNSDYVENRGSGLLWGMAKSQSSYGIFLDAGTHLNLVDGKALVIGRTPAIIVDARQAQRIDFSTYRASSSIGPRQSAALIDAVVHVVPAAASFDFANGAIVHVAETLPNAPRKFRLMQNYPNPFNPSTTIYYHLAQSAPVSLKVTNIMGQTVSVLVDGVQAAGEHSAAFNGASLASGVYLYHLQVGHQFLSNKMTLLR